VESAFEGEDLKSSLKRSQFEELNEIIFSKLTLPIEEVISLFIQILIKSNKTISDISRIELLGGGIRIPRVQDLLASSYPSTEIGQHLNGDEAMTFGAAFHAANKTNLFRVRPIYIYEAYEQGF